MVPSIDSDYILLLGIVFYIRNSILLGLTTKNKATPIRVQRSSKVCAEPFAVFPQNPFARCQSQIRTSA